jgi:methyl-accepting chemotaxis protein
MFTNLNFKRKIGVLVGVSVAGIALCAIVAFFQLRASIVDGRRQQLVTAVQAAQTVVIGFQERANAGELSLADAQKGAKDALRAARYGAAHADYFYVFSAKGDGVMHPIRKEWEGQSLIGKVTFGEGHDLIQEVVDAAMNSPVGAGFVESQFPRPGEAEPVPKLQYAERVKGWDWASTSSM